MRNLRLAVVAFLAAILGYCSAGAPALAQETVCNVPPTVFIPRVHMPEESRTPLLSPDNRTMASWSPRR